jgi:hypothetical protein
MRASHRLVPMLALGSCWAGIVHAQEIEPRAYSPSPGGVNFAVLVAGYSEGGVLTDPSIPVTDIEARIDALGMGYGRTFGIAGRSANFALVVPYIRVGASGNVGEARASVSREGFGDAKLRLAVNLFGGPSMTPAEFARREPRTTLGLSLTMNLPTGEYLHDKLVNIGTNRWAAKTELGLTHPVGKWLLEGYVGAWWFEDNEKFFGRQRREQEPLASIQAHLSYTFRPRLWVALNTTYYRGGQTTVDGTRKYDRQSNSRAGLTISLPVGSDYSMKVSWSRGTTTRIGSSFSTFAVGLQYAWLQKR